MSGSRTHRLLLRTAATDATFEIASLGGEEALVGKCIHCGRKLVLGLDGSPRSHATLEHIVPRHHGGGDAEDNLAIACARCNAQKGYRHDLKHASDPKLAELIELLRARRRERWRPPLPRLAWLFESERGARESNEPRSG